MKTDTGTTQSDVTTTVEEQPVVAAPSARELAIAAIDQQVELARQQQEAEYNQQTQPTEPQPQQQPAAVPAQVDQPSERMHKVKVDGEEMEVTEAQMIENFQKVAAADKRLKEAAEERRQIEEEKRQLEEQKKALAAQGEGSSLPVQADGSDDLTEKATRIIESIIEGDTDVAVQNLIDVLKKGEAPEQVDESKVAEIVQKVSTEKEMERDLIKAKEMFDQEYGFINQNPRLTDLTNNIFREHLAAGKLPTEAAKLAGDEVKQLVAPSAQTLQEQQLLERQGRKEGIDAIVPASSVSQSSAAAETKADPRSIIEEMKRQRGQT